MMVPALEIAVSTRLRRRTSELLKDDRAVGDDRREQGVLVAEEVSDQRGIHARIGGDRAQRCALIAVRCELCGGGFEDRLAGAAVAGPAPGPRIGVRRWHGL